MKKHLIAAAVAGAFAVPAMAQVTLSGSISVGVQDSGAAGSNAIVQSLGGGANAINFASTEDLGGGLRGGFTGQMRFNARSGDVGSASTLLHDANAFISGGFGTVRLGKIAETNNCGFDPWGCTGIQGLGNSTTVTAGMLVGAGSQGSSVSYVSPSISGLTVGYQSTLSDRLRERTVTQIRYASGPITAQYLLVNNSAASGGAGASGATGLTATDGTRSEDQSIGASYNLGVANIMVAKATRKNATKVTTHDVLSVGATIPMGAMTFLVGYAKDDKAASTADTKMAAGVTYALSKRTTVGADIFENEAVGSSTGYTLRVRHTF